MKGWKKKATKITVSGILVFLSFVVDFHDPHNPIYGARRSLVESGLVVEYVSRNT